MFTLFMLLSVCQVVNADTTSKAEEAAVEVALAVVFVLGPEWRAALKDKSKHD